MDDGMEEIVQKGYYYLIILQYLSPNMDGWMKHDNIFTACLE